MLRGWGKCCLLVICAVVDGCMKLRLLAAKVNIKVESKQKRQGSTPHISRAKAMIFTILLYLN
jgi:hypothetical protein